MKKDFNPKKAKRNTLHSNSINDILNKYINSSSAGARNNLKQQLRTRNKNSVMNALEQRLEGSFGEEKYRLLQLGIYIDRQKYLFLLLNTLIEQNHRIDDINLINQFDSAPLTISEQNEVARHIANNPKYDERLLRYLDPPSLQIALDGILEDARNNGLKSRHLKALNMQEEYIDAVQVQIRQELLESPLNKRNMARYLNLQDIRNQQLLSDLYSYLEIYIQLKRNPPQYVNSTYFPVRIALNIVHKMPIDPEDWDNLRTLITQDVSNAECIRENSGLIELLEDLCFYDYTYAEALLISLHMRSALNTNSVISTLTRIKSPFAYRELVSILMATEDTNERYRSAVNLIRNYPEKAPLIISYASELGDETLNRRIAEEASKSPSTNHQKHDDFSPLNKSMTCQIISRDTDICQLLYDIARDLNATDFFVAVGFAFTSGLKLLAPVFDYIRTKQGHIELILGSLQTYNLKGKTNKIDRSTVKRLNELMDSHNLRLFTYEDRFFHGKFYYVGNSSTAYVIIGSTNVSRTAFFFNHEIDILFKIDLNNPEHQELSNWFADFKKHCTQIYNLNEAMFEEFDWNSELDAFSERIVKKLSDQDVHHRLLELDDEETRFRIELWMEHNPTEKLTNLGVDALDGYVAFVYEQYSLAVLEAFDPNEAYYVFRCTDINQLLKTISSMSKNEIATNSLSYIQKGYHIQDRVRLKEKIDFLFTRQSLLLE